MFGFSVAIFTIKIDDPYTHRRIAAHTHRHAHGIPRNIEAEQTLKEIFTERQVLFGSG